MTKCRILILLYNENIDSYGSLAICYGTYAFNALIAQTKISLQNF